MIPLAAGLRAEELLNLTRDQVRSAAKKGELTFLRKGGKEHSLPVMGARELFAELLEAPAARGRFRLSDTTPEGGKKGWRVVREILSPGEYITAYHLFHRLISQVGEKAGIEGLHPHSLRHIFATRMMKDGADIRVIQYALNHSSIATTQRYVHPSAIDAQKFMRDFNKNKDS